MQNAVSALGAPNLTNLTNRVDQISSALTNTVDGLTGLSLSGDLPANVVRVTYTEGSSVSPTDRLSML